MTDNTEQAIAAYVSDRAQALGRHYSRAVRPIVVSENGAPDAIASGVLLRIGDVGFLLSAAHVLDKRRDGPLFLGATGGIRPILGEVLSSNLPASGLRDDDPMDVGIVRLSPRATECIAPGDWLSLTDVDVDDTIEGASPATFFLMGMTATRSAVDRASRSATVPVFMLTTTPAPPSVYKRLGLDDESHLIVDFDQRRTRTPRGQEASPSPEGISGGGVWNMRESSDQVPRLVAIAIERYTRSAKAIVCTRVSMFLEVIRAQYPDLSPHIPRPTKRRISASSM